jgi:CRP-like cAMP-binding protein
MLHSQVVRTVERRRINDIKFEMIARRLGAMTQLSPDELALLQRVAAGPASVSPARSLLQIPSDDQARPLYLISGWAARLRELGDGRRQIVHLILPGDTLTPQLGVRHGQQVIQSLTIVQAVDGGVVKVAARDPNFPGIAAATELAAAYDRALLMEQVTRLGRHTAYERMANLFLELHQRCDEVGLVHNDSFMFPLTQESLGDLLGLSVVHVNRTLQLLRREGMIELRHGRLTLLNMEALRQAGQFRRPILTYVAEAGARWSDRLR